ncbi:type I restriction enzyme HsdR N-terminal domain-containing protein [Anabaena cylindrica FACHB-243]|nr:MULTISPECIES: type I restriction enzyme HsdR N-terminal domain-containing protein [Anabaena]MBD2416566.1 type I restriction enzyme HsdR N-terminal domain-containing protein [Anabaena cylindrica FACHB-243]MBY5280935.1 type I restriction enzyme HsdR N-terminal domain-containing protein [Anabaena sp. CCAP 1446/1C]MCM2407506.1 type I restriction enzyme HsdR N-terminal domain-containing protein [Anabaena sp. CCAP 1446/1C]
MTNLRREIETKLNIYTKKYQEEYIKCLIRGIEIPIKVRPEELVRQLFLDFMINESGLFPDFINIKVEANNHDVEIYKKPKNDNFQPYQPPLMIIELKREDVNLYNHYNQIQRYLKKACCNIGILYNYHEIVAFTKKNENFEINNLKHLRDIQSLISKSNNNIDNDLLTVEKSQNGDFESFIYLIKKYGQYTTNRIIFQLKSEESSIVGYFFNIKNNRVYYDVCGKYDKKQRSFNYQDFEKLISITY